MNYVMCKAVCRNIPCVCLAEGRLSLPEITVYAVFAIRLLAFSAQQCVLFVWESTSDGLVFKRISLACKSCL